MAETRTARVGLPRYGAGTDSPSRADWNELVDDIDAGVLVWLAPGTLALRPAFGVAGRIYRSTDAGVYLDTGAAWLELNPARSLGGANPSASAPGDATLEGASTAAARVDHRHAREAFGNVTASTTPGIAAANGAAGTLSRSDHVHGTPAAGAPVASAVGDAQATGAAITVALSDHRHAREAFAGVPATTLAGGAGAAGAAITVPRGDHVHPLVAGSPVASAVGDAAADGVATSVARADHRHARETLASLRDSLFPAGVMLDYGGAAAPAGWLICNGAIVAQATYPALFAAIGHSFGADPGGGNFRLPDYRGRLAGGAGGGGWVLGVAGDFDAHTHAKNGAVTATGVVSTGLKSSGAVDHFHGVNGSTGGMNNGNPSGDHIHVNTAFAGGQFSGGIDANPLSHGHDLAFNTGNGGVDHSHRYDHGHGDNITVGAPAGLADVLPANVIIKAH